ncbi:hypothetical protein BBJ28_00005460 [Nothophytophthora sp. Chile5]|nr:hypothetical protein BBJ28_00005460 [Nothophytophthora sp. Chile5]
MPSPHPPVFAWLGATCSLTCGWICATAVAMGRRAAPGAKAAVLQAQAPRSLMVHAIGSEVSPLAAGVRMMTTKGKDKDKDKKGEGSEITRVEGVAQLKKKSTFEKVVEGDDPTELPPDVQYLGQQELDSEGDFEELELEEGEDDFENDEDDKDAVLNPQQWAEKFEREVATWDGEDDEDFDEDYEEFEDDDDADGNEASPRTVEDDRLYIVRVLTTAAVVVLL